MTEPTDAEKLAAAQAITFAGLEAEKAARLPSAQAANDFLNTPEAVAFAAQLEVLHATNVDDEPGASSCKRALWRLAETLRTARNVAAQRVIALQPAVPAEPAPEVQG